MATPIENLTQAQIREEVRQLNDLKNQGLKIDENRLEILEREIRAYEDRNSLAKDFAKTLSVTLELSEQQEKIFKATFTSLDKVGDAAGNLYQTITNLRNPSLAFLELIRLSTERFIELDNAALKFREESGFLASQTKEVETNIRIASRDLAKFGVTAESATVAASQLANAFGDTSIANKENLEYVTLMKENLNVSNEDSVALLQNFMGIGALTPDIARETAGAAASLAKAAGVPFSAVMKEVAKPSAEVRALIRGSVDALIKAGIEAKRLGTTLESVGRAAAAVLDFQTSISDEMEASVLFGRDINLQRLRELSYAGNLKEFAKEQVRLLQQAGDVSKMDFFQRQSIAKALGLSVEEMDKMNAKQQELNQLRRDNPELYRQYTAELNTLEKTNETVSEKYQRELKSQQLANVQKKLLNDIQQILVEVSEVLLPIVKLFFNILVPLLRVASLLTKFILTPIRLINDDLAKWINKFEYIRGMSESIGNFFKDIGNFFKKSDEWMESSFGKWVGGIVGSLTLIGLVFGKKIMSLFKTPIAPVPTTPGPNPLATMSGGTTIGGMPVGGMPTTGGTGPMLPASTTSVPSGVNKTAGQNIKDFLKNLSEGIKSFTPLGQILQGLIGITAAGPAFLIFSASLPGLAVAMIAGVGGKLIEKGFESIAKGITFMDITQTYKGILGILALGAAFIPFTYALSLLTNISPQAIFASVGAIIALGAAAVGLGALFASGFGAALFFAGVAGIAALGLAMIPFGKASQMAGEGMKNFGLGIKDVASNISQMFAIKDALEVFRDEELITDIDKMTDAIARLNEQLSKVSLNMGSLREIQSLNVNNNDNNRIVSKLDELITLMKNGGIGVNIDGYKLSTLTGPIIKFRGTTP